MNRTVIQSVVLASLLASGVAMAAPETFVIDRAGRIRFRYPGPLTEDVWREDFEPLLKALRSES